MKKGTKMILKIYLKFFTVTITLHLSNAVVIMSLRVKTFVGT